MPFLSKRQARWAHSTGQPFANRWDKLTDFDALPERKDSATTGMAIPPTGNNALFNRPGIESRAKRRKKKAACTCTEKAASTGAPGEKIAPGITRIRGNLCNVHGRYGPCDKGGSSGGKKPSKGRAGKKPAQAKLTPAERTQARVAEQATNRGKVLQALNIAPDGQAALEALRSGAQPDPKALERGGFAQAGLVEQASDGSYRLTSSGRAMLSAANAGDQGRAGDIISSARDRTTARSERTQTALTRRQAAQAKREQAAQARAKRLQERSKKVKDYPSFTVIKSSDGTPDRWLSITTSAYEDKDREIISTKAIARAVALGDQTNQRGPLRFWHVPGLDIGDCDFQAQGGPGGRFLIEGGTFRSKAFAQLGQTLADQGYQMSPGFVHQRDQPRQGVYDDIVIFERSAVPSGRAANHYTTLTAKEDKVLTEEKAAEYRAKAKDNPEALALLDTLLATTAKEDATAQDQKVAYKETALPQEIEIGGVVYTVKAFPPAAEAVEEEDVVTEEADDGMEIEAEESGMDDAAFAQMIAQAVIQAITPLLDIEKKMAGHMADLKSTLGGVARQKDDATAAQAAQIAALDAKLKELTGDLPSSVMNGAANMYRPSQSPLTKLTESATAVVKEQINQVPAGLTEPSEIAAYQLIFGNS